MSLSPFTCPRRVNNLTFFQLNFLPYPRFPVGGNYATESHSRILGREKGRGERSETVKVTPSDGRGFILGCRVHEPEVRSLSPSNSLSFSLRAIFVSIAFQWLSHWHYWLLLNFLSFPPRGMSGERGVDERRTILINVTIVDVLRSVLRPGYGSKAPITTAHNFGWRTTFLNSSDHNHPHFRRKVDLMRKWISRFFIP